MSPIGLLAMIVDRVLFPAMARQQNRIATLRSAFLMLNGAVFAIFLPLSLVLFEFRHELVLILLGGAWSAASGPFGMLGIGLSFRAGYRLSDIVARARGLVYRRAVVQWIYAGCIVTGGIAGARWGLTGVALGISAAIAVNWLLMTALTNRSLNITWAAVLASLRPTLFTSTLTFLAIVGLNLMLGRAASISLHSSVSSTLVVAAALIASLTLRSAKVALGDWQQILRRAKRAG
jgi:PST family polysaccharide transporter